MKKKPNEIIATASSLITKPNETIKGNYDYKCVYNKNNYTRCSMNISQAHCSSITNIIQLTDGRIASSDDGKLTYEDNDNDSSSELKKRRVIKIWEYPLMKVINELRGHNGLISNVIQLSNGNIASCGYDKHILVYDISSNNKSPIIMLKCRTLMIYSIIELRNKTIASSEKTSICIWDIITQQCLITLKKQSCSFSHLCYIPNDNIIISGTFEGKLLLWSLNSSFSSSPSPSVMKEYSNHLKKINFVTMLSQRRIASCSADSTISIIDGTDIIVLTLQKESKCLIEINEETIALGDYEGYIIIWDITEKECNMIIFSHSMPITSLIKTSDGTIISGSLNKDIKIWC